MSARASKLLRICTLGALAGTLAACSDATRDAAGSGGQGGEAGPSDGGSGGGGRSGAGGGGGDDRSFNQCGVAAPLPSEAAQCTAITAPMLTNFDDYDGTKAGSYTYALNAGAPTTGAPRGAFWHIGDGSDTNGGTSIISTEMVPGMGDSGYALQISNTNAVHWGGSLVFYFAAASPTTSCVDARDYDGVELWVRGASPSGRFGVTLGMLDTTPVADGGFCEGTSASDCKNATVELSLPGDAAAWTRVQLPWSAFTPGVGTGFSCVPVTGQNIARLVIQPFMSYPPPDFMFEPGAYTLAVDDVRFY